LDPLYLMSALPPFYIVERFTSINFAENQLSLSLIGLSPLASTHLRLLQQTSVRPSKSFYPFFSLFKARSLSFGSNKKNTRTLHTRFCFASTSSFKPRFFYLLADPLCKRYTDLPYRENRLYDYFLFQVLFHSLVKVLFTFPSRYLLLLVSKAYLDLEGGPPVFKQILSFYSFEHTLEATSTGLSPSLVDFSKSFGGDFPRCLVFSMFSRRYLRNLG